MSAQTSAPVADTSGQVRYALRGAFLPVKGVQNTDIKQKNSRTAVWRCDCNFYSHSTVAGGLEVTS